jgi:hypothetical protein
MRLNEREVILMMALEMVGNVLSPLLTLNGHNCMVACVPIRCLSDKISILCAM